MSKIAGKDLYVIGGLANCQLIRFRDWMLLEAPGGSWIGFPARPDQAILTPGASSCERG